MLCSNVGDISCHISLPYHLGISPLESHINPYSLTTPRRNHEATKALDRVEEERDEAFAAIAQWEAVIG